MENIIGDLTVIIPVREGSTRIPKKVLLPFKDELNLLEWKLSQLIEVVPKTNILVSSNSENLKNIALNTGVEFHERSSYLSKGIRPHSQK